MSKTENNIPGEISAGGIVLVLGGLLTIYFFRPLGRVRCPHCHNRVSKRSLLRCSEHPNNIFCKQCIEPEPYGPCPHCAEEKRFEEEVIQCAQCETELPRNQLKQCPKCKKYMCSDCYSNAHSICKAYKRKSIDYSSINYSSSSTCRYDCSGCPCCD